MSDKTKKIFIIVFLIIVLVFAIWGFLAWRKNRLANQTGLVPGPEPESLLNGLAPADNNQPQVFLSPATNSSEQSLISTARNFAERYGSFSSDNKTENLKEVEMLATAKEIQALRAEAKDMIALPTQDFFGLSSQAVKINPVEVNEAKGEAKVMISLQRQETRAGKEDYVYYQDLNLFLIKSGADWLIDVAEWVE
jgi:hypothetical protein